LAYLFKEEMLTVFKGTQFEFRNRYVIHVAIFVAGFVVPWDRVLHMQNGFLTWGVLAIYPQQHGWMPIMTSTLIVTALGLFFALAGAFLRTWGTAYLGAEIVKDAAMHGGAVVADGPYRHVRNPLYLGTWLFTLAMILFMQRGGAVFTLLAITRLQLRLIGGEEFFLSERLGEPYAEYCKRVPRLLPTLRAQVPASGGRARWGMAIFGEIYFVGFAGFYAVVFALYGETLLTEHLMLLSQGLLGALGVAIVVKAFLPGPGK
jgi:protein-S-isoprenylcysteine O-methyltransferase Ste14